jgi:para-nitrobenzyl esterase
MSDVRVEVSGGVLRGVEGRFGPVFRSIPYAAPPTGAGRFAAPQPVATWTGERDATSPGATAPMPDRRWFGELDMGPLLREWVRGEDYLTASVWTPSMSGRAPVLVWVHGGAFLAGSGDAPAYDGSAFARDGVVVVTCNYRLGVPGWLSIPGAPDNRGVLDVIAALRWVRENIAAFGGDPEQVTVGGQSAGGMIVSTLLTEPGAGGLFRRAISQSGGLHSLDPDRAAAVGARLADQLGVAHTVDGFAGIPDETLVEALANVSSDGQAGLTPVAVVRGSTAVRPGVELLVGNTSQEAKLYQSPEREAAIDELFRSSTQTLLTAHAEAGGEAHRYLFDWRGGPYGACHAVELPFVFDTAELPGLRAPRGLLGTDVPPGLVREVHDAWVGFVTAGDPGWTGEHRFTG